MADDTSGAVFDRQDLLERLGDDERVLGVVVGVFVDEAPVTLRSLEEAVRGGDCAAVRERAHGLKGAAANLSAAALRDVARQLELAAAASDIDAFSGLIEAVRDEIERLLSVLQEEMKSKG